MKRKYTTFYISRQILNYSWKASKTYTASLVFIAVIIGLSPFASAYIYKEVIDYFINNIDLGLEIRTFVVYAILLILIRLLETSLKYADDFVQVKLRDIIAPLIGFDFLNKVNRLPFTNFENDELYDLINRTEEGIDWRPLNILRNIPQVITNIIKLVAALIFTFTIGWWFAPLIILTTIPQLIAANKVNALHYSITDVRSPVARKFSYLQQLIMSDSYVKEVKLFNSFNKLWNTINIIFQKFADENSGLARRKLFADIMAELLQVFAIGSAYVYIFYQTAKSQMTLGSLTFNLQLIETLNSSTANLFIILAELNNDCLFLNPYFELLKLEEDKTEGIPFSNQIFETIEFKNVTFKYPWKEDFVFKNLNLKIRKNEKLAIVGLNGAGKTTLIKLLLRLYEPTSGKIFIDDVDISTIRKSDWLKLFGVLFQDYIQYAFTVRENIEFGDPEKNNSQLYEIAKEKSDAADIIAGLKEKDNQLLSTRFKGGVNLSGGQWQRIALARMYYRDSQILILDEPTASIDAISEAKIFENVQKLSENKTVIIISHRFSTVRNAHRIIVLEDGIITEEGSHDELMTHNGKYAEMFNAQAKGYK